jgi:MFS transporter, MHS family, proline/betaine transporter
MRPSPRIIISGVIGNALENYDYILYANFAIVIGNLFFPSKDLYNSLIAVFGVFAAGFLTRPLGAIIFGIIGDKYGRKNALSISVILMSIPTSLIGIIPSYAEIGIWAPILLVIIRMMQGLSIGGETSSFMIYLMESIPDSKSKAFLGSIALSSTAIGLLLGFMASFICNFYFIDIEWAWRVPFLLSFPVSIVGFYIRRKLEETPDFRILKDRNLIVKSPLLELIKKHKVSFFTICGIFVSISVPFYIFFGFLATFLVKIIGHSQLQVSLIYLVCSASFIFLPMLSGLLSDRYGINKILLLTISIFGICIFPIFLLIFSEDFTATLVGCLVFIFLISLYQGSIPSLVIKIFPAEVRSIGTALSFNLVSVLFGGFSPLILTWLLKVVENWFVIPAYLVFSSLITIISLKIMSNNMVKAVSKNR